jgi:hypothetical protein
MNNVSPGEATSSPQPQLDPELLAARNSLQDAERSLANASRPDSSAPTWWSTHNAMTMSAVILIFGAVVIGLAAMTLRKQATSVDSMLRLFGTIMIITLAVFLVVAGYNDKQIAAPLGLLGTIAGYLLGREAGRDRRTADESSPGKKSQGHAEPSASDD